LKCCPKLNPLAIWPLNIRERRKFLYQQGHKVNGALDVAFSSAIDEPEVLFGMVQLRVTLSLKPKNLKRLSSKNLRLMVSYKSVTLPVDTLNHAECHR